MIILNLVIKENNKVKDVRPFVYQSSLISEIKNIAAKSEDSNFIERVSTLSNVDITYLMNDNPEVFRDTVYSGSRVFLCELNK